MRRIIQTLSFEEVLAEIEVKAPSAINQAFSSVRGQERRVGRLEAEVADRQVELHIRERTRCTLPSSRICECSTYVHNETAIIIFSQSKRGLVIKIAAIIKGDLKGAASSS